MEHERERMLQDASRRGARPGSGQGRTLRLGLGIVIVVALGLGGLATRYVERDLDDGVPAAELPTADIQAADGPDAGPAEAPASPRSNADTTPRTDAGSIAAPTEAPPRVIDWADPREPSPIEPVPAAGRVAKPAAVRGIYAGAWSVGSASRLASLIRLADETEINAFVIDIKDVTGEVTHATRVPLARQVGADRQIKIGDMRGVLERLREHGIYPIARIVVFKDPLLADARPEWSIKRPDGSTWSDDKGVRWVDSFNREVWEYNIQLAREAIDLGFSEIQWDYVRFPDAPQSYMREAVYPARAGRTMSDGIRDFLVHSRERLAGLDVPQTADVFGITTSAGTDVGIGQLWEKMADVTDVLLPMVYPSHYPRGSWGFPNPNAAPYQIVKKAMDHGVARNRSIENAATIRPWLQAFSMGTPDYTPEYIRAQIDAVYDAGLTEWILWSPSARYTAEPLVTRDGVAPWYAGRGERLYRPRVERDSVAAPLGQPFPH